MNPRKLLILSISCCLFAFCNRTSTQENHYTPTKSTKTIVHSIKSFVETTAPFFDTKYIQTDDGADIKLTDHALNEINHAETKDNNNYYLTTALCQFSSIMALLSKEDAKKYGNERNESELLLQEYQKYLYLATSDSMTDSDYILTYLNAIQSVPFLLKVRHDPIAEDLDNLIYYIAIEIDSANTTLPAPQAYKVSMLHCNGLYSIVLESFAEYLVTEVLDKEITEYPFTELENKRVKLMPAVNDLSELNEKYSSFSDKEYMDNLNQTSEIIAGYFSIINDAFSLVIKSQIK